MVGKQNHDKVHNAKFCNIFHITPQNLLANPASGHIRMVQFLERSGLAGIAADSVESANVNEIERKTNGNVGGEERSKSRKRKNR